MMGLVSIAPKRRSHRFLLAFLPFIAALGCDGGETATSGPGGTAGAAGTAGGAGSAGSGGNAGTAGNAGSGGSAAGSAGTGGSGGTGGSAGAAGTSGVVCEDERILALTPIDKISSGEVTVLDPQMGEVFIDASAGGIQNQKDNPWIYIALGTTSRVDLTDKTADASQAWDVAIKRPIWRNNSGDGGPAGKGGAFFLDKEFDAVTAADASGVAFLKEDWFDDACVLQLDAAGTVKTSFDGWYDYENAVVTPHPGTWLVRGGNGTSVYKLQMLSYYSNPDGSPGMAGGRYLVRIGTLTP